ncbi:MAG TPA: STAS domain-containing protein [Stellaceae bacterium]|nr:STAS domain-containing protein [Stellaceae bacterium]
MSEGALVVRTIDDGAATVLEVTGRLEIGTLAIAREKFAEIVAGGGPVVLDLGHLTYLSSAGLRLIIIALKQAQANRQPFVIAGARSAVRHVLDSIGLRQFCPIYRNRTEALAKLAS